MTGKVNLEAKLASFSEHFSPKIVAELNNYKIAVVKAKGEFVWHAHPEADDFFLVLSGHLTIQLRDRDVELGPGDLYVVPRGVEHCPKATEEAHILLIEPKGTANRGDAGGERTAVAAARPASASSHSRPRSRRRRHEGLDRECYAP